MIEKILKNWNITDFSAEKFEQGLINTTYKINISENTSFILQCLNSIYTPENIFDLNIVLNYLEKRAFYAPKIIPTKRGELYVITQKRIWRLLSYIPGNVFEKVQDLNMAYEAGLILGKFHRIMSGMKYNFRNLLPVPHQSEKIFERFLKVFIESGYINTENSLIKDLKKTIMLIPSLFAKTHAVNKLTITHGDPKITNIIFSDRPHKAISLIDLDGCNKNNILLELGDAFRSWCGSYEDDENNSFDIDKFKSALGGYIYGSQNILKDKEIKIIPYFIKLIILELSSKFLRDYIEDRYFDWNKNKYRSRKEHNLARTISQINLFKDFLRKEKEIVEILYSLK